MTSVSFKTRWKQHLKDYRLGKTKCYGLLMAFNKYSISKMSFEILEVIDSTKDISYIQNREKFWWRKIKSQGINIYNAEPSGNGSVFHSEKSKEKLQRKARLLAFQEHLIKYPKLYPSLDKDCKTIFLKKCVKCDNKFRTTNREIKKCKRTCSFKINKKTRVSKKVKQKCIKCDNYFVDSCYSCSKTKNITDKNTLINLYIFEELSTTDIAKIFNVSAPTVRARLRDFNIKIRDRYSEVTDRTRIKQSGG